MIDTHTHINCIDDFSIDEILKNASDNGVEKLIVPSAYASDIDIVQNSHQNMKMFTDYLGFIHQK